MLKKEAWPSYLYCTVYTSYRLSVTKTYFFFLFLTLSLLMQKPKPIYSIKEALLDLSLALQFAEQCHQRN